MPCSQGIEIVNNDYQNKGRKMKKQEEQKLVKLLKALYKKIGLLIGKVKTMALN